MKAFCFLFIFVTLNQKGKSEMNGCVSDSCKLELDKLEGFTLAIDMSDRLNLLGLDEKEENFIIRDTKYAEDSPESCIMVSVDEVIKKPLKCIMGVLNEERGYIEVHGYTRIVGYNARVHNFNKSKVGEQRDRIKGRLDGAYGFNNVSADSVAHEDALATVDAC